MSGGHGPATVVLQPGDTLGKYTIVRVIGVGGMGSVYEARHVDLDKAVAVKTLRPEYAAHADIVERFLREGKAAARVRHRHAIEMFDVGEAGGLVFLAMEFLEGEDLAARLKREGALSVQATVDLMLPVLSAIDAAHDVGIVHRDLKPANIFLATSRRGHVEPKVLDFGISRLEGDQHQTATDAVLGTPVYMAPEQVRSAKYTSALSDQFSLGVILYRCLTGALPFQGISTFDTMQKITLGAFTRPRELRPELDASLEAAIVRAMANDPAARFPSVAALALELCPFASVGVRGHWEPTFSHAQSAPPVAPFPVVEATLPMRSAGTITAASGVVPAEPPTVVTGRRTRGGRWASAGIALLGVCAMGAGSWFGLRVRQGATSFSASPLPMQAAPTTPPAPTPTLPATPSVAVAPVPPAAQRGSPDAGHAPAAQPTPAPPPVARTPPAGTHIDRRVARPPRPRGTVAAPTRPSTHERDQGGAMIIQ